MDEWGETLEPNMDTSVDEWDELSDAEIDEILGIENGEEEGLEESFLEEEEDPQEGRKKRKKKPKKASTGSVSDAHRVENPYSHSDTDTVEGYYAIPTQDGRYWDSLGGKLKGGPVWENVGSKNGEKVWEDGEAAFAGETGFFTLRGAKAAASDDVSAQFGKENPENTEYVWETDVGKSSGFVHTGVLTHKGPTVVHQLEQEEEFDSRKLSESNVWNSKTETAKAPAANQYRGYVTYAEEKGEVAVSVAGSQFNNDNTGGSGVNEVRYSLPVETAAILLSSNVVETAGARAALSSFKYREERAAELCEKAARAISAKEMTVEAFSNAGSMREALKGVNGLSMVDKAGMMAYRKTISQDLTAQEKLAGAPVKEAKYRDFVASKRIYSANMRTEEISTYKKAVSTYLGYRGVDIKKLDLKRMSRSQIERIIRNPEKYGVSKEDLPVLQSLLRKMKMTKLKRAAKAGSKLATPVRIGKLIVRRAVESDENTNNALRLFDKGYGSAFIGVKATSITTKLTIKSARLIGRVTGISFVANKVGRELAGRVKPKIQTAKDAVRSTVNKATEPVKQAKKKAAQTIKRSINNTVVGQSMVKTRDSIKVVSKSVGQSKVASGIRTVGKTTVKAAKATKKATKKTMHVITTPIRLLGKLVSGLGILKKWVFVLAGVIAIPVVILYLLVFITSFVGSCAEGINNTVDEIRDIPQMVADIWNTYIIYNEYSPEMEDDIEMLKGFDEEVYAECEELGEGHPITDEVLEGHHIDKYGSPDKEKGYTITYLDAYGNELPSRSTNIKDVESICMAMANNSLGEYEDTISYDKDLENFDLLLEDMYYLMVYHDPYTGKPYTYEESEIYVCTHGCEEFEYFCNDASYYSLYEKYRADGCGIYEELEPYNAEGCESREVTIPADQMFEARRVENPDSSSDTDSAGAGTLSGSEAGDEGTVTVTEYYCPGHSVPICFGHRDIDIYVTLYDTEYVIEHWRDFIPEDAENKPYYYMIKEFFECDGFDDKNYYEKARNFVSGDWYDLYGLFVEGAEFSTRDSLTDEEVQAIIDAYDGDISKAREDIIKYGLKWVGRIAYQWGGKASEYSDNAKFGSSTPDYKGRTNGLDCSGFVAFIYGTAIGVKLPASTAGYAGYPNKSYSQLKVGDLGFIAKPGAKSNHVAIYMGKNSSGQDQWLECNSSNGACITTSTSYKWFVDPLG
ncbi:MAG: C40 family peptidase [Lachnospiraceae bacterium]|nr:C40 family peptidase [Lachnospiraceae bacterium]